MTTILYVLLAFLILMLMVTIHEFGHYIAGKILKFKINEFSIGFGPAIFSRKSKKSGELFSIRCIPLGGYCAFEGEGEESNDPGSFEKQAPWKRIIVLVSGALFNIISGFLFSIILLCCVGYDIVGVVNTNIATGINPDVLSDKYAIYSIAEDNGFEYTYSLFQKDNDNKDYFDENGFIKAEYITDYIYNYFPKIQTGKYNYNLKLVVDEYTQGETIPENCYLSSDSKYILKDTEYIVQRIYNQSLKKGDIIYEINGERVGFNKQATTLINKYADQGKIDITVKRGKDKIVVEDVKVYTYNVTSNGEKITNKSVGISIKLEKYSFLEALGRCIPFTFEICIAVLVILWQLITGQLALSSIGGPVTTIATIAGYSAKSFSMLLVLLPLIAANLGVFNLIPFPALDGSHVIFTIIEWIRGKKLNPEIENKIHTIGLLLLFGLVIVCDIYQVFIAKIFTTLF